MINRFLDINKAVHIRESYKGKEPSEETSMIKLLFADSNNHNKDFVLMDIFIDIVEKCGYNNSNQFSTCSSTEEEFEQIFNLVEKRIRECED